MFIKWDEKYENGVEKIDEEHKSVFDEFEKLYALMRAGGGHDFYPLVMEFLIEYIQSHLNHEEAFQEEIQYDKIEEHKELHNYFKIKVKELERTHKGKNISDKGLLELNMLIQEWFVDHIIKEDVKIAIFFNRQVGEK